MGKTKDYSEKLQQILDGAKFVRNENYSPELNYYYYKKMGPGKYWLYKVEHGREYFEGFFDSVYSEGETMVIYTSICSETVQITINTDLQIKLV